MPLQYADMRVGDVLLEHSQGHAVQRLIKAGEALFSRNVHGGSSDIVHAALYVGDAGGRQYVMESTGDGLNRNDITNTGVSYEVYRYVDSGVAEIAAAVAESYVCEAQKGGEAYGTYAYSKSLGSVFSSSSRGSGAVTAESGLWGASQHPPSTSFYCSNFVVRVFQAAGQTLSPPVVPIDADYRHVSPKELQSRLNQSTNWTHFGNLVA